MLHPVHLRVAEISLVQLQAYRTVAVLLDLEIRPRVLFYKKALYLWGFSVQISMIYLPKFYFIQRCAIMFRQLFSIALFVCCINEVHGACWSAICGATEKIPGLAQYPLCARPADAQQELAAHEKGKKIQYAATGCCLGIFCITGFTGAVPTSCPMAVRVAAILVPAVGSAVGMKVASNTQDRIYEIEYQLERTAPPIAQAPTEVPSMSSRSQRSLYESSNNQQGG